MPIVGKASARAGLKVLPLIVQVVLKRPPTVIVQVRSGVGLASLVHAGSGRSLRGTRVLSGRRSRPTWNCIVAPT